MLSDTEIILISYNSRGQTADCINSIVHTCYDELPKITVVDNASTDDTVEFLEINYPDVNVIVNSANLGYAKAVNTGVARSGCEYVIISNTDVIYLPGAIKNMIGALASDSEAGCVGPQQLTKERKWSFSNGLFPGAKLGLMNVLLIAPLRRKLSALFHNDSVAAKKEVEYVDGASVAFRKSDWAALGGWDEDYFFYTEEADFCRRMNSMGKRNFTDTSARIIHFRGGSSEAGGFNPSSLAMLVSSKLMFCRKHRSKADTTAFVILEIMHNIQIILFTLPFFISNPAKAKHKLAIHKCLIGNWMKYFR